MILDFCGAALCNLDFIICGSYIQEVWPPLLYRISPQLLTHHRQFLIKILWHHKSSKTLQ